MTAKMPQVILLGNGINRAYGGISWNNLLDEIADKEIHDKIKEPKSPMPLRAILFTRNKINEKLKSYIRDHHDEAYGKINIEQAERLRSLLSIGADHILTTNYSYELEYAAQKTLDIPDNKIVDLQSHTKNDQQADKKYILSNYNEVKYEGITNKIWHIHGEARKHSSIVLGHLHYGNLVAKIIKHYDDNRKRYKQAIKNDKEIKIISWIDAFIMGDVYILGAGLDLSEIDLWWLIDRKERESAKLHGKLYFYEPKKESEKEGDVDERVELIKIFAEKVEDIGIEIPKKDDSDPKVTKRRNAKYREFYQKAIIDINNKIKKAQNP